MTAGPVTFPLVLKTLEYLLLGLFSHQLKDLRVYSTPKINQNMLIDYFLDKYFIPYHQDAETNG